LSGDTCQTFVGFGHGGAEDIGLELRDTDGEVIASDDTHDVHAAIQACPESDGDYSLVLTMAEGNGSYTVTSWSGGADANAGAGDRGTCARPRTLALGETTHGETTGAQALMMAPCARGPAPEVVYEIEVEERGLLSAHLSSNYDGVLYLMRSCGQAQSTVACNDDAPDTSNSRIATTVDPGTYFLVVDGFGEASGSYELTVNVEPLQELPEVCEGAEVLQSGVAVQGTTMGRPDYFHSTCAGSSQSPDRVYTLNVEERSRYRVRQTSQHDGSLYIRSSCTDPTSEIDCNDDFGDTRHSLLTGILEPGSYAVISDGFSSTNAGEYSLSADVVALSTIANTDAAGCDAAEPLTQGELRADTMRRADEFAPSCGGQGASDQVYRLSVTSRSRLSIEVGRSEFEGVIAVYRGCGAEAEEVACGAERAFSTELEPGDYFVVVDGRAADQFGAVEAQVTLVDLAATERACRRAPMLRPGRTVSGDTRGNPNLFEATCAGRARSGDAVYRLRLPRRSYVNISSTQQYDGAIYIRSECGDIETEVACNDDHVTNRASRIETNLEAGTYYVFVDGFQSNSQGEFSLDVEVGSPRVIPETEPRPLPPPRPGTLAPPYGSGPGGGTKAGPMSLPKR